ncbi:MAG: cytochrome c biogenesis protein CcdA [Chloroflexota bacterium]|nr:cytochrome c biogenesis protein CcdA [Chloroflexota bacterium]
MASSIFLGGSLVAAVLAGVIALFAPCCISIMLPAYFASSFPNRGLLVAMTFLFAAGVATIILPLAMGASVLRQVITGGHTPVYVVAGLLMLGLGAYMLAGGQIHLPMPGRRAGTSAGPLSVYGLGLFSGVASSCCAPVLAGVIALSGVASSFAAALGLGSAYVLGMVAPLFVISLLWERVDWRASRLFKPRSIQIRLGPVRRTLAVSSLASGLLLVIMGAATVAVGLNGEAMPVGSGWQADLSVWLQHYAQLAAARLAAIPGWLSALGLAALVSLLAWRAYGELISAPRRPGSRNDAMEVGSEHENAFGESGTDPGEPAAARPSEPAAATGSSGGPHG